MAKEFDIIDSRGAGAQANVIGLWQSRRRFRVENIACRTIQKVGCIHRICPPLKMGIIKAGAYAPVYCLMKLLLILLVINKMPCLGISILPLISLIVI
mgnify:CR=1 FL=1